MNTDSEIIAQSRKTPNAFAELFDRHARVVGSFAAQRVGSDVAEDVVAETFLEAFRQRERFDLARPNARPWLFGIAVNIVARHRSAQAKYWNQLQSATALTVDMSVSPIEETERRLDARRALQQIMPTINRLNTGDREALLLFAWAELSYEEIAEALRIPVGTVRSRLNRARKALGKSSKRTPGSAVSTTLGETS